MDNVTHSLIGILQARTLRPQDKTSPSSKAILWASVLGNNLPDLDFIIPPLISRSASVTKLEYLMHHRGYTHTGLGAMVMAAVFSGILVLVFRLPKRIWWPRLFGVAVLGTFLHLFADSWNNYGVHPFWPISNRWFYGDSIFIVEPLLIFALLPLAVSEVRSRVARVVLVVIGAALLAYSWVSRTTPFPIPLVFTVWVGFFGFIQWKFRRTWPVTVAVATVLATFFTAGSVARARLNSSAQRDLILSPSPGNPLCWRFLSLETGADDAYLVRLGGLTLAPNGFGLLSNPRDCGYPLEGERTAPTRPPIHSATDARFIVTDEFRATVTELRDLARENCRFRAGLSFFRAPFWSGAGEAKVFGDLRYDREKSLGFAELSLTGECPGWIPPWTPPRQDLLE